MAYALLSGGVGGYPLRFEIHDLASREIVTATPEALIEFGDAEEVLTVTANLLEIDLKRTGSHALVLFADDQDIARFTFRVIPYEDGEGDDGTQDDEET
jgi:precorrin-6x reductase